MNVVQIDEHEIAEPSAFALLRRSDDGNVERHAGNLGALAQNAFVAEHHKARGQPDLIHVKQLRCKFRADPGRIAHREGYGGQSKLRHEELLALQTRACWDSRFSSVLGCDLRLAW